MPRFIWILFLLTLTAIVPITAGAQDDFLIVTGKMKLETGKLSAKMEVQKNGSRIRIAELSGNGKFEQKVDKDASYLFIFSQEGYVTKKIDVDTRLKIDRAEDALPFLPFSFEITLFEQYEGVNTVVFNQPVARIKYNPELDDFDYDTDYSKSIQERMEEAEKEVAIAKKEKIAEEKKQEKAEPATSPEPEIKSNISVKKEAPPTTPRRRSAPPLPPAKKKGENIVVLHSYTVGEMRYPNLNAYGFINFGDGGGRREITKEQFDEYAKIYHSDN